MGRYNDSKSAALLNAAKKLPPAERILLVEQIWDSLSESDAAGLTAAQQREVSNRLARLGKTGPRGEEWSVVKRRILKQRSGK